MKPVTLQWSEVTIQKYKASGPGGQHKNKTETAVRMTHKATGVKVEVANERSFTANKEEAFKQLQGKLTKMAEERIAAQRKADRDGKPEASFSAQIRTVRLCGNAQGVTDHRTGVTHPSASSYLQGDIDRFLMPSRSEASQ